MTIKIKVLEARNPAELAKLLEKELNENESFASPIIQSIKFPNRWISFVYSFSSICYFPDDAKANPQASSDKKQVRYATDKQLAYAQQLADKLNENITLSEDMTSFEVSKLIESLKLRLEK